MNLIERFGYDAASKMSMSEIGLKKDMGKLQQDLLEYRRQHNIFEVGDQYVMLKLWHDDLMTVEDGEMDEPWWNTRIIRHITNEEREAGHRLPD